MFDYIIVGAGPAGLTTAWLLARRGKKCVIIDRAPTIGGCHRVKRVDGYFGEHGPRIYSDAYLTLKNLLKDMGTSFDDIFTPYRFQISKVGGHDITNFKIFELYALVKAFFWTTCATKKISMEEFMRTYQFTAQTQDYIDRVCRLTDGAGADRYSLYQFLNIINHHFLYDLYQPQQPNDIGLFAIWEKKLRDQGVQFLLGKPITRVLYSDCQVTGVQTDNQTVLGRRVVLAIPPQPMYELLKTSHIPDVFGFDEKWVQSTNYNHYVNVTFIWSQDVLADVPRVWGFPRSPWGLAHIVLSDYFVNTPDSNAPKQKTIISTSVTIPELVPANISVQEYQDEIFRQLAMSYPQLINRKYDKAVINNGDTAYIAAANTKVISFAGSIRGLYNVGTHNGRSHYAFTSMESAVTNAVNLVAEIEDPSVRCMIGRPINLRDFLFVFILLVVLAISFYLIKTHVTEFNNLSAKNIFIV